MEVLKTSIGIGCTSYLRPDHIELFKKQIEKHTDKDAYDLKLHIEYDDFERKGIAYRKTKCIEALKECEYLFLFDDDVVVIKDGWIEYFIEAHRVSGQSHFNYLLETSTIKAIQRHHVEGYKDNEYDIMQYNNTGGCFMTLTKEVVEKVGGFGDYKNLYGMEHCGYTERIFNAGLNSMGKYLCPVKASEYIYSMDYQNNLPYNKIVKHCPSMIKDLGSIGSMIKQGVFNFNEDVKEVYRAL